MRVASAFALVFMFVAWPVIAGGRQERQPVDPPVVAPASENEAATDIERDTLGRREHDPVAMDDRTAELLFAIGMLPFENRIASEDFTLAALDVAERSLSESSGKLVLLNFWATWCPPCREEMPSMQTLYDEIGTDEFEIIAVNVLETRETAAQFVDEMGFTYPVLLDRNGRVMLRYGVRAYPTTYLIDAEGYVIGVRPGYHDWGTDAIIDGIRALIEHGRPSESSQ